MYTTTARRIILSFRLRAKVLIMALLAITIIELPSLVFGQPEAIAQSLVTTYAVLSLALPVIFVSGVVSGDFRSGIFQIWLQKPIDPLAFYLRRFWEEFSIALVLTLLALGATRLGIAALGSEPVEIGELLDTLPLTLIVGAMAFGFSAWLPRGSAIGTIAFAIAGAMAGERLPDLLGRPWSWLADAVLIPMTALEDFRNYLLGESNAIWIPLARIVAYSIGWTALGALGVWYTVNKGRLPNAEQS